MSSSVNIWNHSAAFCLKVQCERARPRPDNVHETSASLISRRVTWSREPGATAGASSRTKHLEHGHTEGLVPPSPGSVSSGCLLTERTRTLVEGGRSTQPLRNWTWWHTTAGLTVGTCMSRHLLGKYPSQLLVNGYCQNVWIQQEMFRGDPLRATGLVNYGTGTKLKEIIIQIFYYEKKGPYM